MCGACEMNAATQKVTGFRRLLLGGWVRIINSRYFLFPLGEKENTCVDTYADGEGWGE